MISGFAIKSIRIAMGLRQLDLAESLKVTTRTIMRWEHGSMVPKPEHESAIRAMWKKFGGKP
jgi:DNA-binding transcriptional regulator YiaG